MPTPQIPSRGLQACALEGGTVGQCVETKKGPIAVHGVLPHRSRIKVAPRVTRSVVEPRCVLDEVEREARGQMSKGAWGRGRRRGKR